MTDLLATQKTDGKGLRIRQRSGRLAGQEWLLAVLPRCVSVWRRPVGWWSDVGNAYDKGEGASAREVR